MRKFQGLHILMSKIFLSILPLQAQSPGISYTLPRAGNVSLAVYDCQGQQVRTLLAGEKQAAGAHTAEWDGLDRNGAPVTPGKNRPLPERTFSAQWTGEIEPRFSEDYLNAVKIVFPPDVKPSHPSTGN